MVKRTTTSAVDVYVQQTIKLTRSIVIKSELSATRVNAKVIATYGEDSVDLQRPETWKYYLNVAGQYHFSDRMMQVISLDTQQLIDFTVANMKIHTATAEAYKYGTRYYFALVRLYPDQEHLIMAINNTANINEAIAAEEGQIIAYYKDLVEPQEYTLINNLERYIINFLDRYQVEGFNNVWKNYPVLNYAVLYHSLPVQIMNLRLAAIKTDQTHSFHITQYLASHGYLDKYIPYMTLKQKLYLYHNIDYIEKYAGFTSTFEELIQWLLSDRYIPLASYTVRQLKDFNEDLYPILRARRQTLGTNSNTAEAEYIPIESLYEKEKPIQPGNPNYFEYHEPRITHSLAVDNTAVIQTKDLESAMVDYTDAVPDTLPDVLLRQWAYMASKGLYKALTNFTHPITGERISLLAKDALVYYSYIFMSGYGHKPDVVPDFVDVKFRLHPRPPVELLEKDLVPDRWPDLKQIALDLVSAQPTIVECFSVSAFFDLTYKIFQECQEQWYLKSMTMDPMKRGIVAKMVSRLYGITCLQLEPTNTPMDAWLAERSLPKFEGSYQDSLLICKTIFQAATGYAIDETKSLRSIQKAMIEMFKQLSSYTIQVMREINDSAVIPLNWPAIRVGFEGQDSEENYQITAPVRINDTVGEMAEDVQIDIRADNIMSDTVIGPQNVTLSVDVRLKLCEGTENTTVTHSIEVPSVRIYEPDQLVKKELEFFLPNEYFAALSQEQLDDILERLKLRS